jgi:hypothetical protein
MTTVELNNDDIYTKDTNTNLYTCSLCSYYTPLKNSFIKHLKTDKHKINENPLECEKCNKMFYTKISFNNHVKSCIIPEKNEQEEESDIDEDVNIENNHDNDDNDEDDEEDLSLLLKKFGNEYDKLMIKYMLLFFLKIKENMLPVNLLLVFVFFMWTR